MMGQVVVLLALAAPNADALIEEGVRLRRAREDAAALKVFQQVYARSKSSRALAQIAFAKQALGRWLEAEADLVRALEDREDPWIQEHRKLLDTELGSIRERLATLEIEVSVEGAFVEVDGQSVGRQPLEKPIRLFAGKVRVDVSAEGYQPMTRNVELAGGTKVRETFALVEDPPAASTAAAPAQPAVDAVPTDTALPGIVTAERAPSPGLRPFAYASGGAALLSAGLGVAFLFVRNGHANDWNRSDCLAGGRRREENCGSDREAAESAQLVSTLGFTGAGVLAVTSAALFLLDGPSGSERSSSAPARGPAVGCSAGLGDAGFGCTLTVALP